MDAAIGVCRGNFNSGRSDGQLWKLCGVYDRAELDLVHFTWDVLWATRRPATADHGVATLFDWAVRPYRRIAKAIELCCQRGFLPVHGTVAGCALAKPMRDLGRRDGRLLDFHMVVLSDDATNTRDSPGEVHCPQYADHVHRPHAAF